jgi:hypothetical protein
MFKEILQKKLANENAMTMVILEKENVFSVIVHFEKDKNIVLFNEATAEELDEQLISVLTDFMPENNISSSVSSISDDPNFKPKQSKKKVTKEIIEPIPEQTKEEVKENSKIQEILDCKDKDGYFVPPDKKDIIVNPIDETDMPPNLSEPIKVIEPEQSPKKSLNTLFEDDNF